MKHKKEKRKPMTLYLDPVIWDMLDTYTYFTHRNKKRICNEAIKDYLEGHLKSECERERFIQWEVIGKGDGKEIKQNLIKHLKIELITWKN